MQTETRPLHIGADVAKDEIVVACEEQHFAPHGIANRRPALAAFLKTVPPGSHIGMESTGSRRGPFVMNTEEQIQQASADYRGGTF